MRFSPPETVSGTRLFQKVSGPIGFCQRRNPCSRFIPSAKNLSSRIARGGASDTYQARSRQRVGMSSRSFVADFESDRGVAIAKPMMPARRSPMSASRPDQSIGHSIFVEDRPRMEYGVVVTGRLRERFDNTLRINIRM